MQNYLKEQTVFYQKVCKLRSAFRVLYCQGIVGCSVGGGCQTSPNDTPAFLQKAAEADNCRLEQPAYWSSQLHEVWNYRCTILVPWFLTLKRHVCVLSFKHLQFHSIVQLWFHTAHQDSVEITNKMQPCNRTYYSTVHWRLDMFRAVYRSSSGALTVFAASGLHTHVVTGHSQVWEFPLRLDYEQSPHAYVNQRLQIQLELLMMSGMPLETCWAFKERWNNKFYYKVASCWLCLLSHTTMHGSMNIKSSSGVVLDNFNLLWTRQLASTFNSLLSFLCPALCIVMPKHNPVYVIWVCSSQWNL